ncbi:hypothetical protein CDAR_78981 [Caerostris darwini]|uniref:Uncharacterized protein n=1 Tax=Caerostris darwini TaxID=1538125 RepID=A0AAV4Q1G0_9ARAC|nr:hypothetical protein CDAR_78981 [Caerostris darwini]
MQIKETVRRFKFVSSDTRNDVRDYVLKKTVFKLVCWCSYLQRYLQINGFSNGDISVPAPLFITDSVYPKSGTDKQRSEEGSFIPYRFTNCKSCCSAIKKRSNSNRTTRSIHQEWRACYSMSCESAVRSLSPESDGEQIKGIY